jgi:hypothetical protein
MTTPASPLAPQSRWYRDRWPWLLMLGPAIVVVAGFATLWIAIRSDDGLVADDYYKRGLAINQTLERTHRGADLNVSARVDIAADGQAVVQLRADGPMPPVIRLHLVHPTRAGLDDAADLVPRSDGRYAGRLHAVAAGRWMIIVETGDWRLGPVETTGDPIEVALNSSRP